MSTPATEIRTRDAAPAAGRSRIAAWMPAIARVLMGLAFFVFGLNGFLDFLPAPEMKPDDPAVAFGMAMMNTGYLFQLVKGTEVVVGALLLANRFVPLALVVIAPVLVNIVALHAFLAPDGIAPGLVLLLLELYLAWVHRDAYRPLLRSTPAPSAG